MSKKTIFEMDFSKATASEHLIFMTIRLVAKSKVSTSTGTGFIYVVEKGSQQIPVIVTNKHVIEGADTVEACFHEAIPGGKQPTGSFITIEIQKFSTSIVKHPDPLVDLVAIFLAPTIKKINNELQKDVFYVQLQKSFVATDDFLNELSVIEDVVMVGYPLGLWDSANNLPIARRGTTASHPLTNFQNRPITVVDLACFPGSSGSPVFILNEGMYSKKGKGSYVGSRIMLLGVLFGGPTMTAEGKIEIREIPTKTEVTAFTQLMIHLGYIVRAKALIELDELIQKIVP